MLEGEVCNKSFSASFHVYEAVIQTGRTNKRWLAVSQTAARYDGEFQDHHSGIYYIHVADLQGGMRIWCCIIRCACCFQGNASFGNGVTQPSCVEQKFELSAIDVQSNIMQNEQKHSCTSWHQLLCAYLFAARPALIYSLQYTHEDTDVEECLQRVLQNTALLYVLMKCCSVGHR